MIAHAGAVTPIAERTPRATRRLRLRSWSVWAVIVVTVTAVLLITSVISTRIRPPLTPDSWAYLLLARSFASTPYHIPVIRQYQYVSNFSDSFPPLWPLVLFLVSRALRIGPWIGIVTAGVIAGALLPTIALMLRPLIAGRGRRRFAAAAVWAAIISTDPSSTKSSPAAAWLWRCCGM